MFEVPVASSALPAGSVFHHIGCATASIDDARALLIAAGYVQEGASFRDEAQGVSGCFLVGPGPRLELLENLPGAETLTPFLAGTARMYHLAYLTPDLGLALSWAREHRGKILRPPTPAPAFDGRQICFVVFRHGWILEFIQSEPHRRRDVSE